MVCTPIGLQDLAHAVLVMRVAEQRHEVDATVRPRRSAIAARARCCTARARTSRTAAAARLQAHDLTAQLGADRAARARHHDDLAVDTGAEQRRIRRHRIATEQIAGIDVANVLDARVAGENVAVVRNRLHQQGQRLDRLQDFLAAAARLRRQGEQHSRNAFVANQIRQRIRRENTSSPLIVLPCNDALSSMKAIG